MSNKMRAVHPGEILRDELNELGLSANAFATALGVPTNRITGILNAKRAVSADTALRLAYYFGTAAEFWLNLQMVYELKICKDKSWKDIQKEVEKKPKAA